MYKEFATCKAPSPSYIMTSKREILKPAYMKSGKGGLEIQEGVTRPTTASGYSFARAKRMKESKDNDYRHTSNSTNPQIQVFVRQNRSYLRPGYSIPLAGKELGSTYGTRNYDPRELESRNFPGPGSYQGVVGMIGKVNKTT